MRKSWHRTLLITTLALVLGLVAPATVYGQDTRRPSVQAPDGWESYAVRPLIEDIPPQSYDLGAQWEALKAAHFSYIAELMGMYPVGTHFYFLARDGELLYDTARLVTSGTEDFARVHLLNISSLNIKSPALRSYLAQNGVSAEALTHDHDIVFVDTGFRGSVPETIRHLFNQQTRLRMRTQLIVNDTHAHPSSRAFLAHLNPSINKVYPGTMRRLLAGYEHLPRFTDRSTRFLDIDGVIHPLSPIAESDVGKDGAVSRTESFKLMADLKAEWQKSSTQARFAQEKEQVVRIKKQLMIDTSESRGQLATEIAKLAEGSHARVLIEAQIRDMLEARANIGLTGETGLADIGIGLKPPENPARVFMTAHQPSLCRDSTL